MKMKSQNSMKPGVMILKKLSDKDKENQINVKAESQAKWMKPKPLNNNLMNKSFTMNPDKATSLNKKTWSNNQLLNIRVHSTKLVKCTKLESMIMSKMEYLIKQLISIKGTLLFKQIIDRFIWG